MPRCLNLALAGALACFVVGCATQSKPTLTSGRRIPKVRTTAYTHHEGGSGAHNAVGTYLSGRQVLSAASDWSRYPLGTRFRLADTKEEYVIDDYGNALVGTDTIDLYKATRSEVKKLGCPLCRHRHIAMGFGGRKFESSCPALQTSIAFERWSQLSKRRRAKPSRKILPGALRLQISNRRRADARDRQR